MAIHDQNYVRYDGPLRAKGAWMVIAWTSFRTYLSFWRTKFALLFMQWILPAIFIVLIFVEYMIRGLAGDAVAEVGAGWVTAVLRVEMICVIVTLLVAGCGVVSEDLRYRTFQLYFSKPITRADYALGKFLGLWLLAAQVSVIPMTIVSLLRGALFIRTDMFKEVALALVLGVVLAAVFSAILAAIVAGLSSLTNSQGTAVLMFLGVIFVPQILSLIVAIASGESMATDWFTGAPNPSDLWSITGNMSVVTHWVLDGETFDGPAWVAPVILSLLTAGGLGALVARVSKLEGVA